MSFVFAPSGSPWIHSLADALARSEPVWMYAFHDWHVYFRNRPSWPSSHPESDLRREMKVFPTGYAGWLEPIARPFMRRIIHGAYERAATESGLRPWFVVTRPYMNNWISDIPTDRLIYHNVDEYTLYRPSRANHIRKQEDALIREAEHVFCVSDHQVQKIRNRHSDRKEKIHHLPHGVDASKLNIDPRSSYDSDTVGYVGNLTDRIDWALVRSVVQDMQDIDFVFVGGLEDLETGGNPEDNWKENRAWVFSQPNVKHTGRVPQEEVASYYASFSVTWIPYDADHPFNIASCPTKIMDSLASGRPVVSTPVPECTLYPEWIRIAEHSEEIVHHLRESMRNANDDNRSAQVDFARKNTWAQRADNLRSLLSSKELSS